MQIIKEAGLDSTFDAGEDGLEKISFAVIDLSSKKPVIGGVNMGNLIYPASVYKMYVAMEVLRQISIGKYSLFQPYVVPEKNVVDFTSQISWDPRPLLMKNDTVSIEYLLDLMITRSDNTASNCLIDIADRKNINETMHRYGWFGSEVTRKFLSRKKEDPGYENIQGTQTSAVHAAEFMRFIYRNELINPWVSQKMKILLGAQLDTTKLASGLPKDAVFYHKTGWWDVYTNDVGIVDDGIVKYVIALFTPVREERAREKMKLVSQRVYEVMKWRVLKPVY